MKNVLINKIFQKLKILFWFIIKIIISKFYKNLFFIYAFNIYFN